MNNDKHPIYEIAHRLGLDGVEWVEDDCVIHLHAVKPKHQFSPIITLTAPTESEALDALLQKLRDIACPDYQKLKQDFENLDISGYNERELLRIKIREKESELSALKAEVEKVFCTTCGKIKDPVRNK